MTIKIGILSKSIKELEDWELKIFHQILSDQNFQLVCLFFDGREFGPRQTKSIISKLKPFNFIYKWQVELEEKFFKKPIFPEADSVRKILNQLPHVYLHPKKKNFVDFFDSKESNKVTEFGLDVLLRHEFGIIKGDILKAAKNGIWSFHHADNDINRGGPAGFWEARLRQDTMGITLQQLTAELDGGKIIDKAFFNNQFSFIKNKRKAQTYSAVLLLKHLRLLAIGKFSTQFSKTYSYPLYRRPGLYDTFGYLFAFYSFLFKKKKEELLARKFNLKLHSWSIAKGKGNFLEAPLFRVKELNVPKNSFWADPFLYRKDGRTYIYFEDFSYRTHQASISCGELIGNKLENIRPVLSEASHYSYPHLVEEDGQLYMIPETALSNRMEIYKCVEFPYKWEMYNSYFEGESIADVNYFEDKQGDRWLFLSKSQENNFDHCNELYIYKIDSLALNKVTPHQQNPVIIDSRKARNGGPIFTWNEVQYRPAQVNIKGIYGFGLKIHKIKSLSLENYEEEEVTEALPYFRKGLTGVHHLHQLKDFFVIDLAHGKKPK